MGPYDERRASEEKNEEGLGREDGARACKHFFNEPVSV